jgi:hypothetical protein
MIKEVTMPNKGDLKVWWIPQVPMKPFEVPVKNIDEAHLILNVLAAYDYFQYKTRVKGDYANIGGLLIFEDGEWLEWENEEGENIDKVGKRDPRDLSWSREIFKM